MINKFSASITLKDLDLAGELSLDKLNKGF